MANWERKRILIWGKTRPELSRTYRETVCTGGVLEDTRRLVRLYPIPLRLLNDQQVFRKYQWIDVDISRTQTDPRPESFHVNFNTIEVVGEPLSTSDGYWTDRAFWVMAKGNVFASVEELLTANAACATSLGIVRPDRIIGVHAERFSEQEKQEFWAKYRQIKQVRDLPFMTDEDREIEPIRNPDFRFKIRFESAGKVSDMTVLDWEVDALYFGRILASRSPHQAKTEVTDHLQEMLSSGKKDTHFFLGNSMAHPRSFSIVGLWYPKKRSQLTFDDFLAREGFDAADCLSGATSE